MTEGLSAEDINFTELMDFYKLKGRMGRLRLNLRLLRSWILQKIASNVPSANFAVTLQRARGVRISPHVYIGEGVHLDLLYPSLITIEDHVSIGMRTMIFAHSNPTNSSFLKRNFYQRKVAPVKIGAGAWIAPGSVILCGVTIGKNSVVGAGSVVVDDVPDLCVVVGAPARPVKRLEVEEDKQPRSD